MHVEIHSSYEAGIRALAAYHHTTEDGIVNSLVYQGLRSRLTDEVLAGAMEKVVATITRQLKLNEEVS